MHDILSNFIALFFSPLLTCVLATFSLRPRLAEKQGMRAASFFRPDSEAEMQGKRPSYYLALDDKFPGEKRVERIIAWLRLPPEQRPHLRN